MRLSRERLLLLVLAAATAAVWWLAWGELPRPLTITVLDVGQGDSILVQAPSRTVLVDGGGSPGQHADGWDVGRDVVVPALLARGVKRIDVLVITHPDEDHIGGLPAVLEAVPVGLVLDPMLECHSDSYAHLNEIAREKGVPVHRATEGQRLNLGEGIFADVLNPPDPRLQGTGSDRNENSIVLRIVCGHTSALLTGDIDRNGVARLARLGEEVRSTILKVPHHGSADGAVPEFYDAVRPELAVISVGAENPFGHPSPEVLREAQRVGAKVMRTDQDGAVTICLTGQRWSARGYARRVGARRLAGAADGAAKETR